MSVKFLFLISSVLLLVVGVAAAGMPGIRQPGSEWKRILSRLRGDEAAPRLGAGMPATLDEIDRLVARMPEMVEMSKAERRRLAAECLVANVPGGKIVVYKGETSNAAYFILKGSVGVGWLRGDDYVVVSTLGEGEFFGEVAALTGRARTANVITEEESRLLIIPAKVLRGLTLRYAALAEIFTTTMSERLRVTDMPTDTAFDQILLKELRTENLPVGPAERTESGERAPDA